MFNRNKVYINNTYNDDNYNYDEGLLLTQQKLEKNANIAHMGKVVQSSKTKNIIGTMALDTCFGIVFYDRKNKSGIVGHAAPSSKIATLQEMIDLLNKDERLIIEYAVVPGYRNVERKDLSGVNELVDYLHSHCPSNVVLVPIQWDLGVQVHEQTFSYEFAFDVNSCLPVSPYLFYDWTSKKTFYK